MRVILIQRVDKLGDREQVCDVSSGYARNYLIPRGLAKPATPSDIEKAAIRQKRQAKLKAQADVKINEIVENIKKMEVTVSAKANPAGRLFGSVDEKVVRLSLKEQYHVELPDGAKLDGLPIRKLGKSVMRWRLPGGRNIELNVNVTPKTDA